MPIIQDENSFTISDINLDEFSDKLVADDHETEGSSAFTAPSWQIPLDKVPANMNIVSSSLDEKLTASLGDARTGSSFRFPSDDLSESESLNVDSRPVVSPQNHSSISWGDLGISRSVLNAISKILRFPAPTAIQRDVIPSAISGKDILAAAATGSGKTAAFLLPLIERILVSPGVCSRRKDSQTGRITGGRAITRGIVMLPTRELAVQCWAMFNTLTTFVPVTAALVVGGFDSKDQRTDLSRNPDIIIATPGRLLDHLLNSQGVHLDQVDMVVLDEADRLLDLGFKESITEILKAIPKKTISLKKGKNISSGQCQTMLFSATLTAGVKELASFVLSDAVTARVTDPTRVVSHLVQEFLKIGREEVREAVFFSLLESVVQTADPDNRCKGRVIVFFREKRESHRIAILAQIFGLNVAELNGNMSQAERSASMAEFQSGRKRYLFATDLASRGLDLPNVELVINYNLPAAMDAETRYIHRVGRTARMGRSGRAITIFTGEEYPVVKRIVKKSIGKDERDRLFERKVSVELCQLWESRISKMQSVLKKVEDEEKVEKELYISSKKIAKVRNMSVHATKIMQRPEKQWINGNKSSRQRKFSNSADEFPKNTKKQRGFKGVSKATKIIKKKRSHR